MELCYYRAMENIVKNKEYIVTIEGYTSEGAGVARLDGRAVFIANTIRGEIWHIKIIKVTSAAIYAKGLECIRASEERVTPQCPTFGKCGGCDTWHMAYEEELRFKLARVNDALHHIGKQDFSADTILGCEQQCRYRNKGIFNITLIDGKACYGFYRQRSHELVPIEKCLIQKPLGERVSKAVCEFLNSNELQPYSEEDGTGTVRHVFCRSAVYTTDAVACIISACAFGPYTMPLVDALRSACPELTGIVLCINNKRYNTILSGEFYTLFGKAEITDYLGRNEFVISPQAFYQINPPQAERLYTKAMEYASAGECSNVLELYCGAGTISMFLAEKFKTVTATEIVPEAIENAKENAARNGFDNITFLCGDAAQTAQHYLQKGERPNCVVTDPPRKGMDEDAIRAVAEIAPERIVYISCNPATLARDILRFNAYGYALKEATAVDMFPRTCHVETVVLLERSFNRRDCDER